MKVFGKEFKFNNYKIYHAGDKPTPSEIGAAASSHTHNYAGSSSAGGAANSATILATARTINGTSFNGSTNITTANWGTARTLTIGNTGKSVNGSGNVSWSLSEIGAIAAVSANGYYGLALPDKSTVNWIRTTTNGIIPYQSGGASALGTESWPFNNAYIKIVYGSLSGNATTATTLQTARTINGTSFNGSANITTANWGTARTITIGSTGKSVNGSGNVSWSLSEIGAAAASHSHSYLPLSGGTMTGAMTSSLTSSTHIAANKGTAIINSTAAGSGYNMLAKMNSTNGAWTMGSWGTSFNLFYTANTTITAGTNSYTKRLALLDESGNSAFPGTVSASSFSGSLSGNASTATTLQTARTINGTSFNGSANITTANWGTARTITIGSTGKSVNGSGNVSWSLAEIGAAAASHSHSYLPLSGGTVTGKTNFTGGANVGTTLEVGESIWMNNNKHIVSKDTSGNNVYLVSYNSSNNFHLGSTIYDSGMTTGSTFLNGATAMYIRTVNGSIHIQPSKQTIASIDAGGINLNQRSSDKYKYLDIHRICSSNTTSGYTHSTARIGCVNSNGGCVGIEYRENDKTLYYFQVHKDSIYLNGYRLFLQTGTPTAYKAGDVWIDI